MVRGKLRGECFGADYPGECAEGAQIAAEKLRPILNIRFPNETKPKVVMTDKGKGFYDGWTSQMNPEYRTGLRKAGLRALMGEDNKIQPGQLCGFLAASEVDDQWPSQALGGNQRRVQSSFARVLSRNKRRARRGRSLQGVPRQIAGAERKGGRQVEEVTSNLDQLPETL